MSDVETREFGMAAALRGLRSRGHAPSVIHDIGAADGGWTRLALTTFPQATAVCFEPLAERRAPLEALAGEFRGRVRIEPVGLGDVDGELELGVTEALWDSSFAYPGRVARQVPVRRLDSMVADGVPRPDFLKIDVQGFEERVLEGGRETLAGVSLVLLECSLFPFCPDMQTLDRTVASMSRRGFRPYEFVDFLRRPLDNAMGQCDLLFIREGHPLVADHRWG